MCISVKELFSIVHLSVCMHACIRVAKGSELEPMPYSWDGTVTLGWDSVEIIHTSPDWDIEEFIGWLS